MTRRSTGSTPRGGVAATLAAFLLFAPTACKTEAMPAVDASYEAISGTVRVPLVIEERLGVSSRNVPVRFGLPLASGRLDEPGVLRVVFGETELRASTQALSRWPDGSVKWLQVDLVTPAIDSGERLEGWLYLEPAGPLAVDAPEIEMARRPTGLTIRAGELEVSLDRSPPFLGRMIFAGEEFLGASRLDLETDVVGKDAPARLADLEVEQQAESSVTIRAVEQYLGESGRVALEVVHRLTAFRDSPWVKWQQTLQVIEGRHRILQWRLDLPFTKLAPDLNVQLEGDEPLRLGGDFAAQQVSSTELVRQKNRTSGRLTGSLTWEDGAVGLESLWQLFPKGLSRDAETLSIDFAPPIDGRPVVLEEGFGRTHTLWLVAGEQAAKDTGGSPAQIAASLRPRTTPEWYLASGAFDGLLPSASATDDRLLKAARASAQEVFERRDRLGEWSYGLHHFGDFFDREHTLAYFGALNQEYDPALVLVFLFARTGDSRYLDWATELAWHYADVDIAPSGGVFQHRATEDHARNWITGIMAENLGRYVRSHPSFDGSSGAVGRIVDERVGAGSFNRLRRQVSSYLENRDATERERQDLILWMLASRSLGRAETEVRQRLDGKALRGKKPGEWMEAYVRLLATSPRARKLGFNDPDEQFAPFFELYGGSWKAFPSFHVSNSPEPLRHSGDHALVEGLVFAHWLTGEPRLREASRAVARHHVDWLVEREIRRLPKHTFSRTVAWPLVNLMRLWEMTQGVPEEEALHLAVTRSAKQAADALSGLAVTAHGGSIHAGISLEGLARYHQLSADPKVARYLVELANHWTRSNYDARKRAFYLKSGDSSQAGPTMSGLVVYGVAYAASLKPGPSLRKVATDARTDLPRVTDDAKEFAMLYRSSLRAARFLAAGAETAGRSGGS